MPRIISPAPYAEGLFGYCGKRQQGYMPGPFYLPGKFPLMFGAIARYPPRDDPSPLGDE